MHFLRNFRQKNVLGATVGTSVQHTNLSCGKYALPNYFSTLLKQIHLRYDNYYYVAHVKYNPL